MKTAGLPSLFGGDIPKPQGEKKTPPERTWERPDYLPGLETALAFRPATFAEGELIAARDRRDPMLFDVEVFPNYFLCSFASFVTGQVISFEMTPGYPLDVQRFAWVLHSFCLVGFNSKRFDEVICTLAVAGGNCEDLMTATGLLINHNMRPREVLDHYGLQPLTLDHIDLIDVAPQKGSLKLYGGKLHSPVLQELPFAPGTWLSDQQITIVRHYNIAGDIQATGFVLQGLREQIDLRYKLGAQHGIDLRSKSDAQIAEAIISKQVKAINGRSTKKQKVEFGKRYRYMPPAYMQFQTPFLQSLLQTWASTDFTVAPNGRMEIPPELGDCSFRIGRCSYQMGVGGLHTQEQRQCYVSDAANLILDRDVSSYYPYLILNSGVYPEQLGPAFQSVYRRIVDDRIAAKVRKDHVGAETGKIAANGTFGKLGSPYSILYAPQLLIQITISGQLSLLMLIEQFELAGIPVISANTDGVVSYVPKDRREVFNNIVQWWETVCNFTTEETEYAGLYSRDVNNYIAVKPDGKIKAKGAYLNPWHDPKLAIFRFHKSPTNFICTDAVTDYLSKGIPIVQTIRACQDVRQFLTVRTVRGGAVKNGEYFGKAIRWYYAKGETGEIIYATSGNKVPRTDGARPLMQLPERMPVDLDFEWYEREAEHMLAALGLKGFRLRDDADELPDELF